MRLLLETHVLWSETLWPALLAGMQTQPAVLDFACEQSGNEAPYVAYAGVYPLATVAKIVIAQLLLTL